ncbi:polymorphic toxin-type HINT domain-containing protein, partial [Streptomyces diastaticus]
AAARAAAKRAAAKRAAAAARQRAQRAAAKRAQAARAAARKARANKAPKAKAKPKSQPKPKSKPSQKSKPTQRKTNKVKEEAREQAKDAVGEEAQAQSCEVNSFVPGTKVLMADGSKKPIEDVRTGDKVLATDPKTGETKPQPVAATIIGKGDKTLVTVTIRTSTERAPTTLTTPPPDSSVPVDATQLAPDEDGEATSTIVATDGHPFWVPELNTWLDAGQLQPGQWLHTSAGTWVQITAVSSTTQRATVHNLTVADVHTYYAVAGATPVLVHNCGVTRGGNESTYSISHDASGSGVIADLDSDGILTMMMHNNPDKGSPLRGKAMFDEVMGHFGDRVQGIQGIWVYGDNLGGFNEAVRGGAGLVSAAKGTWTGRQAARYGFTRARIDEAVPRLDGDFQQVLATFRR